MRCSCVWDLVILGLALVEGRLPWCKILWTLLNVIRWIYNSWWHPISFRSLRYVPSWKLKPLWRISRQVWHWSTVGQPWCAFPADQFIARRNPWSQRQIAGCRVFDPWMGMQSVRKVSSLGPFASRSFYSLRQRRAQCYPRLVYGLCVLIREMRYCGRR